MIKRPKQIRKKKHQKQFGEISTSATSNKLCMKESVENLPTPADLQGFFNGCNSKRPKRICGVQGATL